MKAELAEIKTNVTRVEDRIETGEEEVATLRAEVDELRDTCDKLNKQLTLKDIHDRKSNLQFYGIPERGNEDTEKVLRRFFTDTLKLTETRAAEIRFKTVHRLPLSEYQKQNNPNAQRSIMANFIYMGDREEVYNARKQARGTGKSIQTDLPPMLKKCRAILGRQANTIQKEQNIWTRVRVDMVNVKVVIETRDPSVPNSKWTVYT
jgi:uncharacterized protein (DUF111 family)